MADWDMMAFDKMTASRPRRMAKIRKRKKDYIPLTSMPTQLECPKCDGKLRIAVAGAVGQIYTCQKCGYRGSVGLEPGIVKIDNKKKV